jgi:hypothetical protein
MMVNCGSYGRCARLVEFLKAWVLESKGLLVSENVKEDPGEVM